MNSGLRMASASLVRCDSSSPHPIRLLAANKDEKQSLLDLGRLQMLFGNYMLSFSCSTVDHGNLVGFSHTRGPGG
jgi:hypothetical protein